MNNVWILIEQMDYESKEIHSVYSEKPNTLLLTNLIKDSYGYAFGYTTIKDLANKLHQNNEVRFLELYNWKLEERAVVGGTICG